MRSVGGLRGEHPVAVAVFILAQRLQLALDTNKAPRAGGAGTARTGTPLALAEATESLARQGGELAKLLDRLWIAPPLVLGRHAQACATISRASAENRGAHRRKLTARAKFFVHRRRTRPTFIRANRDRSQRPPLRLLLAWPFARLFLACSRRGHSRSLGRRK